mgnify:CR=1 FL=1
MLKITYYFEAQVKNQMNLTDKLAVIVRRLMINNNEKKIHNPADHDIPITVVLLGISSNYCSISEPVYLSHCTATD